ncbi:MAG: hypothetical protein AB8B86_01075 [Pseudomonadales bacterium]
MSNNEGVGAEVSSRNEDFVDRVKTRIWLEERSERNPYLAEDAYCHGYNCLDLMENLSYSDMIFLLLKGDLPNAKQAQLFSALLIAFINPGPRDNASRAAVQASIGKTDTLHILPIALNIFSGEASGAKFMFESMRFIARAPKRSQAENLELIGLIENPATYGFGKRFNSVDPMAEKLLNKLAKLPGADSCLAIASELHLSLSQLEGEHKMGVLKHGVVAATLSDLGFLPKQAPAIFQLMSAPGILAHGLEYVGKPRSQVPFLSDDKYQIIREGEDV